ncbi:MAG: proline--tRNA ligase [Alphaproteobacteria bacterium]|nr:proline--tRNA ligase [Alphaproteobacteria bacterium]
MRSSRLVSKKHKEKPAEAQLISHIFLLRGGYVRPVANGIYSLLMPAKRIQSKIIDIIREEMDKIDGQEIQMPITLPRELWDESGRWDGVEAELLRFQDRSNHDMLLAMTHEEAVVALARTEVTSYKDYPFMLYQFQTKFRDEARSRGGLVRVREFVMKDAYSFHTSQADLDNYYNACAKAYHNIFRRCGIPEVVSIQSDSGKMGGKVAHEYQLLTDSGEDKVVVCEKCKTYANNEVAICSFKTEPEVILDLETFETPNVKTIEELEKFTGQPATKMAKMVFYTTEKGETVGVIVRGDVEVNECKLGKILQSEFMFASDDEVLKTGAIPGFASGIGLKCRVLVDYSVANGYNMICGANREGYHMNNFNVARDIPHAEIVDIATVKTGDICSKCGAELTIKRGIEVGNIFKLGTRYSKAMNMTYTDDKGQEQTPIMGCYGIGIGRLLASVCEVRNDAYGPIWPLSIAPWQVQLCAMKLDKPEIVEAAESIYADLQNAGVEILYDDRNLTAGVQFAEADLTGIPLRLIVAPRALAQGMIEYKIRGTNETGLIPLNEVTSFVQNWIQQEMEKYK